MPNPINDLTAELKAARERIAELEKALEPFAKIPPVVVDLCFRDGGTKENYAMPHYWCVVGHPGKSHFTSEDIAEAVRVLNLTSSPP